MFLKDYVNPTYYDIIINNYDKDYLLSLNEKNFQKIYDLLKNKGFYFLEDIIMNYLEIFFLEEEEVEQKLFQLEEQLGDKYISKIGMNMQYLSFLLED